MHLLNDILKFEENYNYKVCYGDGNGVLDYYPIPYTPIEGIFKLLPSQYIDLKLEKHIAVNEKYLSRQYSNLSRKDIRDAVIQRLGNVLKCVEKEFGGEIWLPLTAGYDSRTILAAARKAGVRLSTYTIIRKNIREWDKNIPPKIAKRLKLRHVFLNDMEREDPERLKLFDEHCSGYIVGTERQQFASGTEIPIKLKAMVLWGTVWAAYIKAYCRNFNNADGVEEILRVINEKCDGIVKKSDVHEKSLREWLKQCEKYPIEGIDWRERMYFEQRNGSWVSGAAQAFDLFDSERIAPVNCTDLMELLLSLNVAPGDKSFQKEIVDVCCPKIRRIPYGESNNLFYRIKRKIKKCLF